MEKTIYLLVKTARYGNGKVLRAFESEADAKDMKGLIEEAATSTDIDIVPVTLVSAARPLVLTGPNLREPSETSGWLRMSEPSDIPEAAE